MPTAFVASYGSGKPVIGILAEYDALPGMSQQVAPVRKAVTGEPKTNFGGVCNFRILLPNCNLNGTPFSNEQGKSELFDDLQLIYNETPSH